MSDNRLAIADNRSSISISNAWNCESDSFPADFSSPILYSRNFQQRNALILFVSALVAGMIPTTVETSGALDDSDLYCVAMKMRWK